MADEPAEGAPPAAEGGEPELSAAEGGEAAASGNEGEAAPPAEAGDAGEGGAAEEPPAGDDAAEAEAPAPKEDDAGEAPAAAAGGSEGDAPPAAEDGDAEAAQGAAEGGEDGLAQGGSADGSAGDADPAPAQPALVEDEAALVGELEGEDEPYNEYQVVRASANSFTQSAPRQVVPEAEVKAVFSTHATEEALLPAAALADVLTELDLELSEVDVNALVHTVAVDDAAMSFDEFSALVGLITARAPTVPTSPEKRFLSQRQPFLSDGHLSRDQAVLSYIDKLYVHKTKCEADGKYMEAKAAAKRMAELRNAEAERMRADMLQRHREELTHVQEAFLAERQQLEAAWRARMQQFEDSFESQMSEMRGRHDIELAELADEKEERRPARPKYSRDLLNQRKIQHALARAGEYSRANMVQEAAAEMEAGEMAATILAHEAEWKLKEARARSRQAQEVRALLQRGARRRDELEGKMIVEYETRARRYKNVSAELTNLQRLELVQVESFLESQAIAGKTVPLKESTFRKKAAIPLF